MSDHHGGLRSLHALAWRNLVAHPLRSALTALAIGLGVAMTLAAEFASSALLETLVNAGEGDLQVTHGFVVEQFDLLLGLVGYVLIGVAAFLVFNAFAMAVSQRQQQIGLLRSVGATGRQMLSLVLVEALMVAVAGALLGLALGPLLGQGIVSAMQRFGDDFLAFGRGSISWQTLFLAVVLAIGVTLISTLVPARRATRIVPLAALRPQLGDALPAPSRTLPLAGSATTIILFGTLALAPPGERMTAPWNSTLAVFFVLVWLGCLGLLSVGAIQLAGRWVRRTLGRHSASGRLIGDNIQRNRGRVLLTVLTLAVGPATITGLTGFMTFAFNDLLGDSINRIAAEGTWAVFPFDLERGLSGLAEMDELMLPQEAIADISETVGERATIAAYRFALIPELSFLGNSYFTYVVDPETVRDVPSVFRFSEGDRASATSLMEAGCAVLVTPAVAQRNGVGLGEELVITGLNGRQRCTVAGIGVGYANASVISSAVAEKVGATPPVGLAITPFPGVDAAQLESELKALEGGVFVTRMSDFADLQREVIGLFGVALNGMLLLAVLAAALGVINTTLISLHERRQELRLLRAVGATRRQVRQLVLGENALMGLVGSALGVAAGMGSIIIIVTTFGGNSWGVTDLPLWPAAGRALQPALLNGLVAILFTPLISALVVRPLLQDLSPTDVGVE